MFERLFGNRSADPAVADRVPPGQYLTEKFPVLHYGSVPKTDLSTWDFKVYGEFLFDHCEVATKIVILEPYLKERL